MMTVGMEYILVENNNGTSILFVCLFSVRLREDFGILDHVSH